MKLIDAIVNGYINLLAIVIILLIVCPMAALTSLVGAILSALALNGISKKAAKMHLQNKYHKNGLRTLHLSTFMVCQS